MSGLLLELAFSSYTGDDSSDSKTTTPPSYDLLIDLGEHTRYWFAAVREPCRIFYLKPSELAKCFAVASILVSQK